jgi:hypothetical protein
VRVVADRLVVTNEGRLPVAGARILVGREGETTALAVPPLEPGQSVALGQMDAIRGAEYRAQEAS